MPFIGLIISTTCVFHPFCLLQMPYNPYGPQFGGPPPRQKPVSMVSPYTANPYTPNPYAPPTSLNPYPSHQLAPPSSSTHLALSDLTGVPDTKPSPRSPFEDPVQAAYGSPHSRSPSPSTVAAEHARIAELAKKSRVNELLLDDPYSDAYKRPESPVSTAHAASLQGGNFDVMRPEKTGQALLDDLAGLGTPSGTNDSTAQSKSGKHQSLDLSEYGAPSGVVTVTSTSSAGMDSASIPSSTLSQVGSSSHDIWSPTPSSMGMMPSTQSSPSPSGSRFSAAPSPDFPLLNIDSAPRSLSAQPPTSASAATTIGTLIDMDPLVPQSSAPLSPSASQPSITAPKSYSVVTESSIEPSNSNLLISDFGSSSSLAAAPSAAPRSSSVLIDTSDFLVPSSNSPAQALGAMQITPSHTPSNLSHNDSDPLDFFAGPKTERMPDQATQDRLRRCFREFSGNSGTVETGTAGIILENVLPNIDSDKLESAYEKHLRRFGVGMTMTEDTCFSIFVQVWNDCM